jgi:hypothetical protein
MFFCLNPAQDERAAQPLLGAGVEHGEYGGVDNDSSGNAHQADHQDAVTRRADI